MAATVKATPTTATTAPMRTLLDAEKRRKDLVVKYRGEPRVPIILAPQYAAHFGNVMRVSLNGIPIAVRVDGSTQQVPKSYAAEIDRRRRTVDKMLMRMKRLADIQKNAETSPGSLPL